MIRDGVDDLIDRSCVASEDLFLQVAGLKSFGAA